MHNSSNQGEGSPDPALFENENREAIYELVYEKPGITRHQISRELDLAPSTIHWHVDTLEERGLLLLKDSHRDREKLCFTPEHEDLTEDDDLLILYGEQPLRLVALYICEHEKATAREISRALHKAKTTIHVHAGRLADQDLIERNLIDGCYYHAPSPRLAHWAATDGEYFDRPWRDER